MVLMCEYNLEPTLLVVRISIAQQLSINELLNTEIWFQLISFWIASCENSNSDEGNNKPTSTNKIK